MIPESKTTKKTHNFIREKLFDIEKKHNIRILLAVESGSRAWGFPSKNSDYDVRFIYVRQKNNYISVKNYRDVLEVDIEYTKNLKAPLDLNGWDIRKTLQLALKSNAVLFEWLQSPIRYVVHENFVKLLWNFAAKTADIECIRRHYFKLMDGVWKQIKRDGDSVKECVKLTV